MQMGVWMEDDDRGRGATRGIDNVDEDRVEEGVDAR